MNNDSVSPMVSVIIPVYNTERYLGECLDSILGQTFQDFEIICVDDGSTDSSLEILNAYASQDPRIRIFRQQNLYAGVARNRGLENACGKYLYFMDSDDMMKPDLLERAVSAAENKSADIVVFWADTFDNKTGESKPHPTYLRQDVVKTLDVFSGKDIPEHILTFSNSAPWTKLYRRAFVEDQGLQFQALPSANDVLFTKLAFALAGRIICLDESLMYYRIGITGNIQSRKFKDPFRFLEALRALGSELDARNVYEDYKQSYLNYALQCLYYELRSYRTRHDRIEVYRKVLSDPVASCVLEQDQSYYERSARYDYIRGLTEALTLNEIHTKDKWPDAKVVYRSSDIDPDNEPFFSVVIPLYNNEQYIKACLDSIYDQTFGDFEVIVVDDGSADGSLEAAVSYAAEHLGITVLTQENSGPSVSRNNGVRIARGEVLVFVDADDLITPDAFDKIASSMTEHDVVFYQTKPFMDESDDLEKMLERYEHYYMRTGSYDKTSYTGPELFSLLVSNDDYLPSPVFQAVRKTFFEKKSLWFREGIVHEDQIYMLRTILSASSTCVLSDVIYLRRIRPHSIMSESVSWKNVYGYFCSYIEMSGFCYEGSLRDSLAEYNTEVRKVLDKVLNAARRDYRSLPAGESAFWLGLDDLSAMRFKSLIVDYAERASKANDPNSKVRELSSRLKESEASRRRAEKELSRIRSSRSYKIAKMLSSLAGRK